MKKGVNKSRTIFNSNGDILFFGINHFLTDIAKGNCCFICGASPESKEFNDEHIIPNWILKKYHLHSESINLINGTQLKYSKYTVPCCKECNTELGKIYEEPISILLSKPYVEIIKEIKNDGAIIHKLFRWICLIFIKAHLKDKELPWELDRRKNAGKIADGFYWEDMHHIHCIARSHYTGANIETNVYGTIFLLPAIVNGNDHFDYLDSQLGKTVLLQLGEFCIIAVLNDSCAGYSIFSHQIEKISGPCSTGQLREILSYLNFFNLNLKKYPKFRSRINLNGDYIISATVPKMVEIVPEKDRFTSPGKFLRKYMEEIMGDLENGDVLLQEIEDGKRGFLFDNNGVFIDNRK